jgi:hypothetical protein
MYVSSLLCKNLFYPKNGAQRYTLFLEIKTRSAEFSREFKWGWGQADAHPRDFVFILLNQELACAHQLTILCDLEQVGSGA